MLAPPGGCDRPRRVSKPRPHMRTCVIAALFVELFCEEQDWASLRSDRAGRLVGTSVITAMGMKKSVRPPPEASPAGHSDYKRPLPPSSAPILSSGAARRDRKMMMKMMRMINIYEKCHWGRLLGPSRVLLQDEVRSGESICLIQVWDSSFFILRTGSPFKETRPVCLGFFFFAPNRLNSRHISLKQLKTNKFNKTTYLFRPTGFHWLEEQKKEQFAAVSPEKLESVSETHSVDFMS